MKIKKLYGCIDMQTGELVGNELYARKQYSYCRVGACKKAFEKILKNSRYKIVELRPIPLLTEVGCQEQ